MIIMSCDKCNNDKLYCATTIIEYARFKCQLGCKCYVSATNPNGIILEKYDYCPTTPIKSNDHISASYHILNKK